MTVTPLAQKLHDLVGAWGRPPDDAAKLAAGLAVALLLCALAARGRSLLGVGPTPLPRRLFLWVTAFAAALLSLSYVAFYLRGGPRIVDATTYFLQGRALSHGDIAWPVHEPSGSFRGRFLLYRELASGGGGGDGLMAGIFPPGYPILLALGFGVGAPMVVGPALAAAVVIATYRLARTIAEESAAASEDHVEAIARTAALLSVVCGALRYHTADTMSHGATALGIALALDAALRGRVAVAGLVVGAVIATRPVSAVAIAVVAFVVLIGRARSQHVIRRFVVAMLPGILLLVFAQHAATGAWLTSSQRMYYANSDGPPGCFGAGAAAGCLQEHGEFVAARLKGGFGVVAAAGATVRRLRMHLLDIANLEPLALLVLVPLMRARGAARRSRAAVAALAVVGLHVLAYAPFYFDGNYPGGGARLFADVLPLEHALVAVAVARLVGSGSRYLRGAFAMLALALAGFAVHAAFEHGKLADRDGGRPMFEPDLLARANVTTGLVFVDTDHGFALGHDPEARIKDGIVVARLRNDDRDRMLFDALDHPPTFLYKLDIPTAGAAAVAGTPAEQAVPTVVPWAPPASAESLRFEAEADWPVLAQSGGVAMPAFTDACASGSRGLLLLPTPLTGHASATLTVPVPQAGRYSIAIRIVHGTTLPFATTRGSTSPTASLTFDKERWDWVDVPGVAGLSCTDLALREATLTPPAAHFVLEATGGGVTLDRVLLRRLP